MTKKQEEGLRYPPLNDLISKANNKYELVIATSKRAREIVNGKEPLIKIPINNPISIATYEIEEEAIKLENPTFDHHKLKSIKKTNAIIEDEIKTPESLE